MQQHIQTLVKQFFHKNTLQEVTVEELEQFSTEFPYSAIGQYLFAKKLQHNGENGGADTSHGQKEKTTLYFHNPMWCRWLMEEHEQPGQLPVIRPEKVEPEKISVTVIEDEPVPPAPVQPEPSASHIEEPVMAPPPQPEPEPAPVAVVENNNNGADAVPDNGGLVFESYHTVDYFASQGIKLKLEDLGKDKLGQQLKSFTEWLRSMKRVQGTGATTVTLDDNTNQSIQQIAELSNAEKDVVTEAMAEVWAKQGNKEKATEIYEKLSLLNPAKNAYFAAKIDQLKAL